MNVETESQKETVVVIVWNCCNHLSRLPSFEFLNISGLISRTNAFVRTAHRMVFQQ